MRQAPRTAADAFFAWAEATLARVSAKPALAEALRQAVKRKAALSRFLPDARPEADSNRAENAPRAAAPGRRNWAFAGSDAGGKRAAAIRTLIEAAKMAGHDPERRLAGVLAKVGAGRTSRRFGELLPWNATAKAG